MAQEVYAVCSMQPAVTKIAPESTAWDRQLFLVPSAGIIAGGTASASVAVTPRQVEDGTSQVPIAKRAISTLLAQAPRCEPSSLSPSSSSLVGPPTYRTVVDGDVGKSRSLGTCISYKAIGVELELELAC